ncbi:HIT/MYND zinc finger-like protein [Dioscorea alata]|uniref:HIT/MYND zinc finger-like protein n=2 Tax=Dioscorea alata TaxID=55571 RepID=A0ACB7WR36_DIOAL|nr:HIT/MYND zinc finger-like protein [Dioscorea alata]KAH7690805.1 HIT/MYND zinc finger-like protein [Dioscorea alata]
MECAARGSSTPCAPGPATRRCGNCGAVAYCSLSHQMSHWNDHKDECPRLEQQMRRVDALNDFPFSFTVASTVLDTRCSFLDSIGLDRNGIWSSECCCGMQSDDSRIGGKYGEWSLPSILCPCTEPRGSTSTCLSSWKDYYQWRCLPLDSPVAILLHWPLTIYHCFRLTSAQTLTSGVRDKLHIHYLGPDKELYQLAVFGELKALFPGIQLHIELVGPAVPQFRDGEETSLCEYLHCSDEGCPCKSSYKELSGGGCKGNSSVVTLKLRKGFYHDKVRDILKQDSYPHLIVAPNAGVAAYSSWLPTIELIKEMGVLAVFTDYCEEAANLAACCISNVTNRPLKLPIQINPFRQPFVMEDSALYLPCYSNCFIFGI